MAGSQLGGQPAKREVGEAVLGAFTDPIAVGGRRLTVSLSIGLAHIDTPASDAETLVRAADVAMHQAAAMRMIESDAPDLILLDIMLPRRDGFDVCRAIRANPQWKNVRIVMLTAKGREPDRRKGLQLGADDYITKPFSNRAIVERVHRILDGGGPVAG